METNELNTMLTKAQQMLAEQSINQADYEAVENFILKNGSRLAKIEDFNTLKSIMSDIAQKHGLRDITHAQEHFGLNSCAQ